MRLTVKLITGMLLVFLLVMTGCNNFDGADNAETSGDMTGAFESSYADILALDEDAGNLLDYEDEINAALSAWDQLSPDAKELLSAEKETLDKLTAKINALYNAAGIFYLAPEGNDTTGDGSRRNPWFSVNKAEAEVSAGGTVYLRGGVYHITEAHIGDSTNRNYVYVFPISKSGTAGSPITYAAYPGDSERPIFDMSQLKPEGKRVQVFRVEGSYRHFKRFDVVGTQVTITTHTQSECFRNLGSNNIYEELSMHDGMAIGLWLQKGSNNLVLNCDAYNNWDSVSEGGRGENTDGFGAHLASAADTGNVFRGCRAWYNSDDGYDLIGSLAAVTFDNCWSFYNGYKPDTTQGLANGTGFKSGGYGMTPGDSGFPNPVPRHTVQFSLAAYNKSNGFYSNHHLGGINWYNNTAYKNARNFDMTNRKAPADPPTDVPGYGHELINNLSYSPRNAGRDIYNINNAESTRLNNSFDLEITITDSDFISVVDWTELRSPRKSDGSLPDINFLKPAVNGQLINRGKNIGFPYSGSAPELGCKEVYK
jgi:hypothetical protein